MTASPAEPAALPAWATLKAQLRTHLEQLAHDVDQTAADRGFLAMLDNAARLWRYSPLNQVFIHFQRRDATAVRGQRVWEAAGRKIREGEKPIYIGAPRSQNGRMWPAVAVPVFDVAQTEGPALTMPAHFDGEAPQLAQILRAPAVLGVELRWMEEMPFVEGVGYILAASLGGRIVVTSGRSELKTATAIVHELAHELLHQGLMRAGRSPSPRSVEEAEAHSTTYVVLKALGLTCEAPKYIVWQGGRGKDIARNFERILEAARAILAACEGETVTLRKCG